MSEFKRK